MDQLILRSFSQTGLTLNYFVEENSFLKGCCTGKYTGAQPGFCSGGGDLAPKLRIFRLKNVSINWRTEQNGAISASQTGVCAAGGHGVWE